MRNESKILGLALPLLIIFIILYGAAHFWAGFIGIQHHLGTGWAVGALVLALIGRFTLPMTIGSFFGAMNVWGWNGGFALIFAAPGLAFMLLMLPGLIAAIIPRKGRP